MRPGEVEYINREHGETPEIAENVGLQGLIDLRYKLTIEKDVFTGFDIMILTGGHDIHKFGQERMGSGGGGPVTIHEGVWIATRAMIIGPAEIGKHSVIAAGSVVTGNVPEYVMVAGNPAVIKKIIPH